MSVIATAVRFLLAAGVSGEDLVLAIEEMENAKDVERPRSTNAERQARYRARKAQECVTSNVTSVTSVTTVTGVTQKEEKEKSLTKKEKEEPQSPKEKTPKGVKKKGGFPQPDGVSDTVWRDFCLLRSKKRAAITETAILAIQREAEGIGWTLDEALAECSARGWQGFKAKWVAEEKNGKAGNRHNAMLEGFGSAIARDA